MNWLVEERPTSARLRVQRGWRRALELTDGRIVVPINVGEKATLPARVTALGEAGHASTPTAGANAVPRLPSWSHGWRPTGPASLLPETR